MGKMRAFKVLIVAIIALVFALFAPVMGMASVALLTEVVEPDLCNVQRPAPTYWRYDHQRPR